MQRRAPNAVELRPATAHDLPRLAAMMGVAFHNDPVSRWLWPDPAERSNRQPRFFQTWLDLAHKHGTIITTADGSCAALWLEMGDGPPALSDDAILSLISACGPRVAAFFVLDHYLSQAHPREPHTYLPFIAALPGGTGLGTALLQHKLTQLDVAGRPAYLEASSVRSIALYEWMGFQPRSPIEVPDGPTLYPMVRRPVAHIERAREIGGSTMVDGVAPG